MKNFFRVVLSRKREKILVPIASEALRLLDQACGTQVVVAVPLSNGLRSEIERRLMKLTGQKICLEIKRVPSLVGELVLRLGNRTVDASIKRKLQSWGLRRPTPPCWWNTSVFWIEPGA